MNTNGITKLVNEPINMDTIKTTNKILLRITKYNILLTIPITIQNAISTTAKYFEINTRNPINSSKTK